MKRSDFQYHLPENLIAQNPPEHRGGSRLLCLERSSGKYRDRVFADIESELNANDLIVFNNTRVVPARLFGRKESGGKVEILLERILHERTILAQVTASKSPREDGFLVSRALLQADALTDGGLEELVPEHLMDLIPDVAGQDGPPVIQGDHRAENLQIGVGSDLDLVDGLQQVVRAFQGEIA